MTGTADGGARGVRTFAFAGLAAAIAVAVRLAPALVLGAEVSDLPLYRQMGEIVIRGDSVYAPRVFFPYMPYSQVVPTACLWLSTAAGVPFHLAMKLPNVLGDALASGLIVAVLAARRPPREAFLWALALALNPVSILVSAFHGNLMGLVSSLVAVAFALGSAARDAEADRATSRLLAASAALVLGIAVAMRSFPVFLVPALALWLSPAPRRAAGYAALAALPAVMSALPYLLWDRSDFLREVLGYSGLADLGWLAAFRAIPLVKDGQKLFDFGADLMVPSKLLFLAAMSGSLCLLPGASGERRVRLALVPPLLFYVLYAGVAAQYLVWIVPLAALLRERALLAWSAVATVALVAFYRVYHPSILFGPGAVSPDGTLAHVVLLASSAALVAVSAAWAWSVLRSPGAGPSLALRAGLAAVGIAWGVLAVKGLLLAVKGAG